jgi:hypothetical protein
MTQGKRHARHAGAAGCSRHSPAASLGRGGGGGSGGVNAPTPRRPGCVNEKRLRDAPAGVIVIRGVLFFLGYKRIPYPNRKR